MTQLEESREPRVGLNAVFAVMDENYRKEVVRKTFQGERQLAGDIVRVLQQAVQGIPAQGHRPGYGPLRLYQRHLSMAVCVERFISGAVLRGWIGLNDALRDAVLEHYRGRGLLEEVAALDDDSIDITGWDSAYDVAMEQLIQQENGHSKDDLMLMSYLLCGAMPGFEGEVEEEAGPAMTEPPPLFQRVLGALHGLPLDSGEWAYAEQGLPAALHGLRESRETEAIHAEAAQAAAGLAAAVTAEHPKAMAFMEIDRARLTPPPAGWANPQDAQWLLEQLGTLMSEYDSVLERAPIRTQEIERRSAREALESQIDEALLSIDALEEAAPPPESKWAAVDDGSLSAEEATALWERADALQEERDALVAEHAALTVERDALTSERDALLLSTRDLEDDLDQSQHNEETFRQLYHLAFMSDDGDVAAVESPAAQSVAHAVTLAEDRFPDNLKFNLNTKSDLDIPFDNPQQVFAALEWLATTYYKAKAGEEGEPDLDGSLGLACTWKYTGFQSETTMGMYREYYETTVDGRKRKLEEHIGKGNGYHRRTIRIAFFWDADRRRVVVGYVGRHQRTRAT